MSQKQIHLILLLTSQGSPWIDTRFLKNTPTIGTNDKYRWGPPSNRSHQLCKRIARSVSNVLEQLGKSFREEQQMMSDLHDNVRPLVPRETEKLLGNVIAPTVQSVLSPCDFKAYRPLKTVLRFCLDNEQKEAGLDFLKNQPRSF
ncbi:hypothetical protein TNCV_1906751 [Trichonephila clavipes]|nr:hypothetical protein TNCV_1906751 [Trichonephila clavipes]